ncbi:MAG: methyltransferase domain-containing protein [Firmicutes bacterium]|nr:methyltransferase domain-containing protein [Bacillota bacterium]
MNLTSEKAVYETLRSVYSDGAFSTQALNRALKNSAVNDKPYITKLFYGVLDKSVQFDYIIAKAAAQPPQNAVAILIKIGLYLLRYTATPDYAAVSKTVELAKQSGKTGAEGFINAVLKKSKEIRLPKPDTASGLAVVASYPEWIVKRLAADYGFAFAHDFLMCTLPTETHIRVNRNRIGVAEFEEKYPFILRTPSKYGYYATNTQMNKLDKREFIVQSFASMDAVQYYLDGIAPKNILDLCAAPGGKSVYLKELLGEAEIVACDIYAHRVELIRKYVEDAASSVTVVQNDATVFNPDFAGKFDLVVCDAPCSGIGVAGKKPEILWNRKEEDVAELSALQSKILNVAAAYVKPGGRLCYSTCTVFKAENDEVCERFLKAHREFSKTKDFLRLYPHIDNCDGFFAASFTLGDKK